MDMFALLKQIDPPLGFGSKCPDLLAYKRLVRMNMPVDVEGKVHFTTTLFALVRVNLQIFMRGMDEMDQADQELRHTIGKTWPFTKRDGKLDLLVPPPEGTYIQGLPASGMLITDICTLLQTGLATLSVVVVALSARCLINLPYLSYFPPSYTTFFPAS